MNDKTEDKMDKHSKWIQRIVVSGIILGFLVVAILAHGLIKIA